MSMLNKKKRIHSANAVASFLNSISATASFDVVVSPIDSKAFVVRDMSIRFETDSYLASSNAYDIVFEWPEPILSEYSFLPASVKSNFDLFYFYKTPALRLHNSWRKTLWITILPHSEGEQHEKDIAEYCV